MSFSSHHSESSMGTALSSPMESPFQQDFPSGRWNLTTRKRVKNLILCFDGTGNEFTGSEKDTNVVKLLSMLDRRHEDQYHYYQTGIGTYAVNEKSIHKRWYQKQWTKVESKIDEGFGMTFDSHVVSGYRFLMQYYAEGDKIYMFGFSRGAYTAKFLARMINTVGLLCKGNEEMVPFAYRLYDSYLDGQLTCKDEKPNDKPHEQKSGAEVIWDDSDDDCHEDPNDGTDKRSIRQKNRDRSFKKLKKFSNTFCLKENDHDTDRSPGKKRKLVNVKVDFLGLWDCVNSVSVMERKATKEVLVHGTARIVRHAVAVDERRVKFKAALFKQDDRKQKKKKHYHEDIKEVWFPGNHGDVGGGWDPMADKLHTDDKKAGFFARFPFVGNLGGAVQYHKYCYVCADCGLCKPPDCHHGDRLEACEDEYHHCKATECKRCHENIVCKNPLHTLPPKMVRFEPCQLSDTPLMWMMKELEQEGGVHWDMEKVNKFKHRYEHNKYSALEGSVHDPIMFGMGTAWYTVLFWNCLEFFPLIRRWELDPPASLLSKLAFWRKKTKPATSLPRRQTDSGATEESFEKWEWVQFPLNMGATRDIPPDAVFHHSLIMKLRTLKYRPQNNHGGKSGKEPCLWDKEIGEALDSHFTDATINKGKPQPHLGHQLYQLLRGRHSIEA